LRRSARGEEPVDHRQSYCDVTTYTLRDLPEQAMSTLDSSGHPVIVVSSSLLSQTPAYGRFPHGA
jgi:hypothetical protein